MPFIRIYNDKIRLSISASLRKHFTNKVNIFIDPKNLLIGLQPSNSGYKINNSILGISVKALKNYNFKSGRYRARWDEKKGMVIAKVQKETPEDPEKHLLVSLPLFFND